jgi:hypothetical protein
VSGYAKRVELTWYGKPSVEVMVEVEIDDIKLNNALAHAAYKNKSKRTRMISGIIKAKVYPVKREQQEE